jgi:hypothetical protein
LPRQREKLCFIKAFSNQHPNHLHKNINNNKHFSKGKNDRLPYFTLTLNFLSATVQNGGGGGRFNVCVRNIIYGFKFTES